MLEGPDIQDATIIACLKDEATRAKREVRNKFSTGLENPKQADLQSISIGQRRQNGRV
jgi:hypothetical protein